MLEREFVPYEIAVALETLGFDEPCIFSYNPHKFLCNNLSKIQVHGSDFIDTKINTSFISAPTYSQCFRWFRNKYNLNAPITDNGLGQYDFIINHNSLWSGRVWDTYEEAELECLKKLIGIVKNK